MDNDSHSLIPVPDGSLASTAPGAKRIMSEMVSEAIALTRQEQTTIQSARFKIGKYEFCEQDYHQILTWADALRMDPVKVIELQLCVDPDSPDDEQIRNGRIVGIYWSWQSLVPLPFGRLDMSNVPELRALDCSGTVITELDLEHVPELRELECARTAIAELVQCNT